MPNRVNEFTRVIKAISGELESARTAGERSKTVPFGEERLSKPKYVAARFAKLGKEEKTVYIRKHGVGEVAKLMKGFDNAT